MVWNIAFVDNLNYTIGAEALDADRNPISSRDSFNLEYIDRTQDWPGVGGNFEIGKANLGRAIKPEGVHPYLSWHGKKGKLPEALGAFSRFFVNDRFRAVIERFEGEGRHQFIPIEILHKDLSHAGDMYLLNICKRLSTLDPEATTATISRSGMLKPETGEWAFSRARIGDHHLWHDRNVFKGTYVSDALHDAIIEEGITGVYMSARKSVEGGT